MLHVCQNSVCTVCNQVHFMVLPAPKVPGVYMIVLLQGIQSVTKVIFSCAPPTLGGGSGANTSPCKQTMAENVITSALCYCDRYHCYVPLHCYSLSERHLKIQIC